jgi:uncharacterized protein (DUF2235 family)
MGRNIVVCCDGTANQFDQNNTNVVKLYAALVDDAARQLIFYHPGVGTMEAPGALTSWGQRATIFAGMAVGYGLERDITAAYTFIMNNYKASEGDRLFLFGFSRGAYTVRAIASLLRSCGILRPGHETLIPYAIRLMNAIGTKGGRTREYFHLVARFKRIFAASSCKPYFVGVWDTVASVGWINNPLKIPYTANNADIQIGRHAIALDERRGFYRPNLWRPGEDAARSGPKDLKQVWFAGIHSDVGGGYPETESGLSKITLRWMLREAEAAGLLVDASRRDAVIAAGQGPDPDGKMHDELAAHLYWRLLEHVPKYHYDYATKTESLRANDSRPRWLPPGSLIHESVFQRASYAPRLPPDHVVSHDLPAAAPQRDALGDVE